MKKYKLWEIASLFDKGLIEDETIFCNQFKEFIEFKRNASGATLLFGDDYRTSSENEEFVIIKGGVKDENLGNN